MKKIIWMLSILLFSKGGLNAQQIGSITNLNSNSIVNACSNASFKIENLTPPSPSGWPINQNFTITIHPFISTYNPSANWNSIINPWSIQMPTCSPGNNNPILLNNNSISVFPTSFSIQGITPTSNNLGYDIVLKYSGSNQFTDINLIEITFYLDCPAINQILNSGVNQGFYFHNYYNGTLIPLVSQTPPPTLLTPNLVYDPSSAGVQSLSATPNSNIDWYFAYQNIGSGSGNIAISDFLINACATQQFLLAPNFEFGVSSNNQPSGVSTWFNSNNLTHLTILPQEFLIIKQSVQITGCLDQCNFGNSQTIPEAILSWSCYSNLSTLGLCDPCKTVSKEVHFNTSGLSYQIERLTPSQQQAEYTNKCQGESEVWQYKITNTGNGILNNLKVNFLTLNNSTLSVIRTNTIKLNGSPALLNSTNQYATLPTNILSQSCNASVSGPFETNFSIPISVLNPSDQAIIEFEVLFLPTDNHAITNQNKFYNHWRIYTDYSSPCQTPVSSSFTNCVVGNGNGISGYSKPSLSVLDDNKLDVNFLGIPSHVTVPAGQTFAPNPVYYKMDFNGFFGSTYDQQTLGNPTTGFLKIDIDLGQGLTIGNPYDISLAIPNSTSSYGQIFPFAYEGFPCSTSSYILTSNGTKIVEGKSIQTFPQSVCSQNCDLVVSSSTNPPLPSSFSSNRFTFYFRISDCSAQLSNLSDLFIDGNLMLGLTAECCASQIAPSNYVVNISLLPNESCFSASTINPNSTPNFNPITSGSVCWLPILERSGYIHVHCPGCKAPGIIIDDYLLTRTTFGLEDNNNDGIASDLAGNPQIIYSPNQITSSYPYYYDLENEHSTYNDEIEDFLVAHFEPGDPSTGGYSYNTNMLPGIILDHVQLFRTFPHSNSSELDLQVLGFDFYVDQDLSSGGSQPYPFIDELKFQSSAQSQNSWSTILKLSINATDVDFSNFFNRLNDQMLFSFSTSEINNLISNADPRILVPPTFTSVSYYEHQQYRVRVRYRVCKNPLQSDPSKALESSIEDIMFATGEKKILGSSFLVDPMPSTSSEICTKTGTHLSINPCGANLATQASLGDPFFYYCEGNGSKHFFVETALFNNTWYGNTLENLPTADCNSVIEVRSIAYFKKLRNGLSNFFSYEIKSPQLLQSTVSLVKPTNWDWILNSNNNPSIEVRSFNCLSTAGCGITSIKHDVPTTDILSTSPLIFKLPSLSNWGVLNNTTMNSPYISDEVNVQRNIIRVKPIGSAPCTISDYTALQTESSIEYNSAIGSTSSSAYTFPTTCTSSSIPVSNTLIGNDLVLESFHPNLDISITLGSTPIVNNTLRWEFLISNYKTNNPLQPPTTNVQNVFLNIDVTKFPGNWTIKYSRINYSQGCSNCSIPYSGSYQYTASIGAGNFITFNQTSTPNQYNYVLKADEILIGELIYTGFDCDDLLSNSPIDLLFGWNCWEPNDLANLCILPTTKSLTITKENSLNLTGITNSINPNSYIPCNSQTHSIQIRFKNSNTLKITPQKLSITYPSGTGLPIVSAAVIDCSPQLKEYSLSNLSPNTFDILPASGADGLGLNEDICFEVVVGPVDCHFDKLYLPEITIEGIDECGDPITPSTLILPAIYQQGAGTANAISNCTDCYRITKKVTPTIAIVGEQVTFSIVVEGNNSTATPNLQIQDVYPPDFVEAPNTTSWPIPVYVPSIGFSNPIVISGAFNDVGSCTSTPNNTVNTATIAGTSSSASACLDVICPPIEYDAIITSDADADAFIANNSAGVFGLNIYIFDGVTLTINNNFQFSNCHIMMGSGSEIAVLSSNKLSIDKTTIKSCPFMWRGITLNTQAELYTYESTIEDAERGVLAYQGSVQSIIKTNFYNCVTGITSIPNYSNPGVMYPIGFEVYGSKFGKTGLILKKEYTGQILNHGKIGFAGIHFIDVEDITIGNEVMLANEFFNINYGIKLVNTNTTITNNHFLNIRSDNFYKLLPDDQLGAAIHADNIDYLQPAASLAVSPLASGTATIEKSDIGLFNKRYNIRIDQVIMDEVEVGVRATRNELCTNSITNCEIHSNRTGVLWYDNNLAYDMVITESRIYNEGLFGCIELHELVNNNQANYRVLNNPHIEALHSGRGILSNGVSNAQIGYNNIFIKDAHPNASSPLGIGININDGRTNSVFCNTTGTDIRHSNFGSIGLLVSLSDFNTISCNHLNSATIGARFGGLCNSTRYRGNAMQNNGEGLHLDNSAIIGDQIHHGNLWVNYSLQEGAVNDNFGNEIFSEFIIHTPSLPYFPITNPSTGWFVYRPNVLPFSCLTSQSCLTAEPDPDPDPIERTSLDSLIATDSLQFPIYNDETRSMARERLLERIQRDTSQYLTDAIFSDFYTEVLNSPTGEINNIGLQLAQALEINPVSYSTLLLTDSLIQQTLDSMYVLDSISRLQPDPNNDIIRVQLSHQLNNLRSATSILTARATNLGLIRDSLLLLNAAIQPTELPDINRHTVFEIVIRYHEEGSNVLVAEYNTLFSIAQQCPYEGGTAVYTARSLLRIINDSIEYFDDIVCLQAGYYRQMDNRVDNKQRIKIVPNPANGSIDVFAIRTHEGGGEIQIYNSIGECVYLASAEIGTKLKRLDTSNLAPGIYNIKVKLNNSSFTEKLVIIH